MIIINIAIKICNLMLLPLLLIASFAARFAHKKYDVGIGPFPMINNVYFKLALERRGFRVETIADNVYYITNEFDFIYNNKEHRLFWLLPSLMFIRSIFRYRCIYIYFNGFVLHAIQILRCIEPYLLKIANVKVVVMPYGSDHQSFKNAKNILTEHFLCQDYPRLYKYSQKKVERDVVRWTKGADYVLAHQECVDYLPYWDEVRWSLFGIDTDKVTPAPLNKHDSIRVFHAPNHRGIKGSSAVEKAIAELKDEGYDIEFVYTHGVSNSEIIKIIQSCDIVIDQLVLGTYSMFSMEAMACGKPVICYIRQDLKEFYEAVGAVEVDELPFISANMLTVKDALKTLVMNRDKLDEYGKNSRAFVVKYHSLDALGSFYQNVNRKLGITLASNDNSYSRAEE